LLRLTKMALVSLIAGLIEGMGILGVVYIKLFKNHFTVLTVLFFIAVVVITTAITYWSVFKFGLTKMSEFSMRQKISVYVFLFIMGFITYMVIPLCGIVPGGYLLKLIAGVGMGFVFSILYSFMVLPVLIWRHKSETSHNLEFKTFLICFLSLFSMCVIYILAYYPGVMSYDSFEQWRQMETFEFNDWHPVFSTLYNWLATRIWHSPAAIGLLNSLLFSLAFALMVAKLKSLGTDKRILYSVALVFVINPVNGIMTVTLWKDIPYSISLLWLTVLTLYIFYSDGRWLNSTKNIVLLIFSLIFSALIRHNGLAPVLLLIAALLIFYRRYWKNIAIITFAVMAVVVLMKGPVYRAMQVVPVSPFQSIVNPLMQVGGIISGNGILTEEEENIMNQILPTEKWKEGYKKYSEVPLAGMEGFNSGYFQTNKRDFLYAWANMALRNPKLAIKAYLDRTAIIWRITNPGDNTIYTNSRAVDSNSLGFSMEPKLNVVKRITDNILSWFDNTNLMWLTWKPATYMITILIFGFVAVFKNGYKWLIVILPAIGNTLGLLLITTSDQPRYYYPTLIVAPFIVAAAFIPLKKHVGRKIKIF